ncbi:MAG: flagellar hook-length control protein FliK [Phycisphaerae bacterium]|nr:flagellar hook-length control protein FliK [Phycisphaerae bacterium]
MNDVAEEIPVQTPLEGQIAPIVEEVVAETPQITTQTTRTAQPLMTVPLPAIPPMESAVPTQSQAAPVMIPVEIVSPQPQTPTVAQAVESKPVAPVITPNHVSTHVALETESRQAVVLPPAERLQEGLPAPEHTPAELKSAVVTTNETNQGIPLNELTSGRPEPMPITASVSPTEAPRTQVEVTTSSTVAETAASEINPVSEDSEITKPGRPVVPSSPDAPAANPVAKVETQTPSLHATESRERQTDGKAFSDDSSDASGQDQPSAENQTRNFEALLKRSSAEAKFTPDSPKGETTGKITTDETVVNHVRASHTQTQSQVQPWITQTQPEAVAPAGGTIHQAQTQTPTGVNLTDQITAHIQTRRDDLGEEMVVRLDPPELGKVRIQFRLEHGELAGVIRVEQPQTHADVQREATAILQRLNEAGVQIKTLDVQMGDTASQGRGEQSFAQAQNAYSMFQQHGGDGRGYGYGPDAHVERHDLTQDDPHAWSSDNGQYVSDSALNVML